MLYVMQHEIIKQLNNKYNDSKNFYKKSNYYFAKTLII